MHRNSTHFVTSLFLIATLASSMASAQETPVAQPIPAHLQANLDLANDLVALDGFAAAKRATVGQAHTIGWTLPTSVPTPDHALPSQAALELTARYGMDLDDADRAELQALDALEAPVRDALAGLLNGFLAMDDASRAAYADADADALQAALDDETTSLDDLGLDLGNVLAARNQFLDRATVFQGAWSMRTSNGPGVSQCPALALDLDGIDTTYTNNCAFTLDVGGNDVYENNAGGSKITNVDAGNGCILDRVGATGAALDLDGDDRYGTGKWCGQNGGGFLGTGLLIDQAGNDTYTAGNQGTNGGGALGTGLLIDQAGDDTYTAGSTGTNGGGYLGTGLLIDQAGHDTYTAGDSGTNGGGTFGTGLLIDQAGDDTYTAGNTGTNGGGYLGTGLLIDQAGDDTYTAGNHGTNGGGNLGAGLLLDASGNDAYKSGGGPRAMDETVVLKGTAGAQVDTQTPVQVPGGTNLKLVPSPDGSATLYMDQDGDDQADDGEEIARTPPTNYKLQATTGNQYTLYLDRNDNDHVDPDEAVLTTPALNPAYDQAPDGSLHVYNDANDNGSQDEDEETASSPPTNYKLQATTENQYTLYLDRNDNDHVDPDEAVLTTPALNPAYDQAPDGSLHVYNDANDNGGQDEGEALVSSPGSPRSDAVQEETLFSQHDVTVGSRPLPPEDLPGQAVDDFSGYETQDFNGSEVPDYPGQEVPDYEGTNAFVTDPVAHALGTFSTRDDGGLYCMYLTPEGGSQQELGCVGKAFTDPVDAVLMQTEGETGIGPLPRGDVDLVFYDPPDVPETPPRETPDAPPATTPDAPGQAVPDVPPVTTPDVPPTPTGSLGSTPEYSFDVDVRYAFDADRLTEAGRVAGQTLFSPVGPSPEDSLWLALHGEQAALTVTVTVYKDGVEVDTVEHSVPMLGQVVAAAAASGSL